MATFKVNVDKLNLRSSPVQDFANKGNVVGVLRKDAVFESVRILENELGRWPVNREGHTVSENFLSEIVGDIPPELVKYHDKIPRIFLDFHLGKLWELPMQEGLKVGIIDTGVDVNYPALKGKVVNLNECVPISKKGNPNHGTTMACIIAGDDPENGIIGVAPSIAEIYSYTLPEDNLTPQMFINAFNKMEENEVKLINISYGEYDKIFKESYSLQEKITHMSQKGYIIICAAGNKSIHDKSFFPAAYENVISVTGLLFNLTRDVGSNFWEGISVGMCSEFYYKKSDFQDSHGTSGAAALITGCIAWAYKSFITQTNPQKFLEGKFNKLHKSPFTYEDLTVQIPQFDGKLFVNLLKSTT